MPFYPDINERVAWIGAFAYKNGRNYKIILYLCKQKQIRNRLNEYGD